MSDVLVSVIVPVYNVEAYVSTCLESVLSQTHRELEVVVVDDGSTDSSGTICDAFAEKDPRIVVFHKENGGLSSARNAGLTACHGEWVAFVDSDDYVSPVFIEALLSAAIDLSCDIAAIPMGKQFIDGDECRLFSDVYEVAAPTVLSSHEVQRMMLYQALDTGAQWRLYNRRRALPENRPFPEGLYYEDLAAVYRIVKKVERVALVDCSELYAYRLRKASIIRQGYRPIKADSSIAVSRQLYREICDWYPELSAAAASRCFSVNRMVYAQVPADMPVERERLWLELVKYRKTVLLDKDARKRERIAALMACCGSNQFSAFCAVCRNLGLLR